MGVLCSCEVEATWRGCGCGGWRCNPRGVLWPSGQALVLLLRANERTCVGVWWLVHGEKKAPPATSFVRPAGVILLHPPLCVCPLGVYHACASCRTHVCLVLYVIPSVVVWGCTHVFFGGGCHVWCHVG